jgi:hypothetical protein
LNIEKVQSMASFNLQKNVLWSFEKESIKPEPFNKLSLKGKNILVEFDNFQ